MRQTSPDLPQLLQQFFCVHLREQRNASLCTIASYRDGMRLLLSFVSEHAKRPAEQLRMADLHGEHLLAFLDHLERKRHNGARTRNQRLAAIRSFLRYAGRQIPEFLPLAQGGLAIPQKRYERRLIDFLTREEVEAILQAPSTDEWSGRRDRVLFATLYNTGGRVSEVIGARVGDVQWNRPASLRLHGKGRKDRLVPLWRKTAVAIREWVRHNDLKSDSPLFPNAAGEFMTRSGVEKRLVQAARKAADVCASLSAKSVHPHVLRHTTAMHLLQSGVDLTVIALWLGHESPATTHLYMTADLNMKEKALSTLQEPSTRKTRYKPSDKVLAFLESL